MSEGYQRQHAFSTPRCSAEASIAAAHCAMIDQMPDPATWDDLVYELAVQRAIEQGLAEVQDGLLVDLKDVRREFLPAA
jgi:predicted transcriptional regulator